MISVFVCVATYLISPVIAAEDVTATSAVRRSAVLLRETWGENIISNLAFGLFFVITMMGVGVAGGFAAVPLLTGEGTEAIGILVIVALVVFVLAIMVAQSAPANILRTGFTFTPSMARFAVASHRPKSTALSASVMATGPDNVRSPVSAFSLTIIMIAKVGYGMR